MVVAVGHSATNSKFLSSLSQARTAHSRVKYSREEWTIAPAFPLIYSSGQCDHPCDRGQIVTNRAGLKNGKYKSCHDCNFRNLNFLGCIWHLHRSLDAGASASKTFIPLHTTASRDD